MRPKHFSRNLPHFSDVHGRGLRDSFTPFTVPGAPSCLQKMAQIILYLSEPWAEARPPEEKNKNGRPDGWCISIASCAGVDASLCRRAILDTTSAEENTPSDTPTAPAQLPAQICTAYLRMNGALVPIASNVVLSSWSTELFRQASSASSCRFGNGTNTCSLTSDATTWTVSTTSSFGGKGAKQPPRGGQSSFRVHVGARDCMRSEWDVCSVNKGALPRTAFLQEVHDGAVLELYVAETSRCKTSTSSQTRCSLDQFSHLWRDAGRRPRANSE